MQERTYELPEDVAHVEVTPTAAGEEQVARPPDAVTLEEMNAKLDAILAALSGRESD